MSLYHRVERIAFPVVCAAFAERPAERTRGALSTADSPQQLANQAEFPVTGQGQ